MRWLRIGDPTKCSGCGKTFTPVAYLWHGDGEQYCGPCYETKFTGSYEAMKAKIAQKLRVALSEEANNAKD